MAKKQPKQSPFEELKEYVMDYIVFMEDINERKLESAEQEIIHCKNEMIAFNLLRKNLERVTNGIS